MISINKTTFRNTNINYRVGSMVNEKITDDFISNLLRDAGIDYTPNGSKIEEISEA